MSAVLFLPSILIGLLALLLIHLPLSTHVIPLRNSAHISGTFFLLFAEAIPYYDEVDDNIVNEEVDIVVADDNIVNVDDNDVNVDSDGDEIKNLKLFPASPLFRRNLRLGETGIDIQRMFGLSRVDNQTRVGFAQGRRPVLPGMQGAYPISNRAVLFRQYQSNAGFPWWAGAGNY